MSSEDIKHHRELWWREHELMNHRLSWLGVVQTLLFTAYGYVSINEKVSARVPELIQVVGVVTSFLIFVGTFAAAWAQTIIARKMGEETWGVSTTTTVLGWLPPVFIPLVCMFVWVYFGAHVEFLK